MKKNRTSKEGKKPRRLVLSRETLQLLSDPKLLAEIQGGTVTGNAVTDATTSTKTEPGGC